MVKKNEMEKLPFIVAIDFDGTLVTDNFPEIGEINKTLFESAVAWQQMGYKLVLWTCRDGERLQSAVEFCNENGLYFDAVNTNIKEVQTMFEADTRKVYANIYVDDKSVLPNKIGANKRQVM